MRRCQRLWVLQAAAALHADTGLEEGQQQRLSPEQPVYLKPSRSGRRKASFLFPRMRGALPDYAIRAPPLGSAAPLFHITSPSCEYYALRLPFLRAGFKRIPMQANTSIPSNVLWGRSMRQQPMQSHASTCIVSSSSSLSRDVDGGGVELHKASLSSTRAKELEECLSTAQMVCAHQRFNHFPRSYGNIGCKWGLAVRLQSVANALEAAGDKQQRYGFLPRTWVYPGEKRAIMKAMAAAPPTRRFIWKPARGSCGRGIFTCMGGAKNARCWERVMEDIEARALGDVSLAGGMSRKYVVQEYIEDPLLLDGRKTDLRLYVAVTSYDPLTVYLHEEGLVRLAAQEYSNSGSDGGTIFDPFRDLTNYSVGKRWNMRSRSSPNTEGPETDVVPAADVASPPLVLKKSLAELWAHLDSTHPLPPRSIPAATLANAPPQRRMSLRVWDDIACAIVKTLLAVKVPLAGAAGSLPFPNGFFELYGFDMMLDAKLKPWLIEVNTLPSLASTSPLDYAVKTNVVSDLLNLAMIEPFERPASCFGTLGDDVLHLTGLLDPLTKEAAEAVHRWSGVTSRGCQQLRDREAKEELRLRLQDELAYCRGFKRIFPPLLSSHRLPLMSEVDAISQHICLTKSDVWALEA
ncbi:putative tubulin-tyrosine ligase-like protein [Trypanosoma grayi]|uniref:putative tubulin-tyrosine ligase-like protein n=1 Tax=Trypanosoma grayi TaxID=71804 RepID=UPI0004F45E91|nr:putative tubulin-tyrosine ligase-like protein [Trypanosoma grayi]KEG15610.1 putative tubulin-tyrosine ligase-like protein [Trypanosoma grayi]